MLIVGVFIVAVGSLGLLSNAALLWSLFKFRIITVHSHPGLTILSGSLMAGVGQLCNLVFHTAPELISGHLLSMRMERMAKYVYLSAWLGGLVSQGFMAFYCFIVASKPHLTPSYFSKKKLRALLGLFWAACFVLAGLPAIGVVCCQILYDTHFIQSTGHKHNGMSLENQSHTDMDSRDGSEVSDVWNHHDHFHDTNGSSVNYVMLSVQGLNLVAVVCFLIFYYHIWHKVRDSNMKIGDVNDEGKEMEMQDSESADGMSMRSRADSGASVISAVRAQLHREDEMEVFRALTIHGMAQTGILTVLCIYHSLVIFLCSDEITVYIIYFLFLFYASLSPPFIWGLSGKLREETRAALLFWKDHQKRFVPKGMIREEARQRSTTGHVMAGGFKMHRKT